MQLEFVQRGLHDGGIKVSSELLSEARIDREGLLD